MRQLVLVLALGLVAAPAAHAAVPRDFVGISGEEVFASTPAHTIKTLGAQAKAGARLVRVPVRWRELETAPGTYRLNRLDVEVLGAATARVRLLPVLTDPPDFRSRRPKKHARRGAYPPRHNAEMGAFAAMLARRYGPNGTLWRTHPKLAPVPIRSWQVWNEPNLRVYWETGPRASSYLKLLRAVGGALKAVDPHAEIVAAGLPQSRLGIPFDRYVKSLYKAGGKGAFDVFALHPYAVTDRGAIAAVRHVHRLLRRYGDRKRPIWVTEAGWSTGGPRSSFRTSQRGQAKRIRGLLLGLAKRRRSLGVRGVVIYNWRDSRPRSKKTDFFGLHAGLLGRSGKHKTGYRAFHAAAARLYR